MVVVLLEEEGGGDDNEKGDDNVKGKEKNVEKRSRSPTHLFTKYDDKLTAKKLHGKACCVCRGFPRERKREREKAWETKCEGGNKWLKRWSYMMDMMGVNGID